jgi:DNA-binding MarR family transcriptional regulator
MQQLHVRQFRKTLRRFEQLVAAQLKGSSDCSGVTLSQCHALLEIENQDELSLGELAQQLGLDKSTLSRTIDGLVNIGLVQRAPDPDDRRSIRLSLTGQGRRTCDQINTENDAHFCRVLSRIDIQRRQEVVEGFDMLVAAMTAETDSRGRGCAVTE